MGALAKQGGASAAPTREGVLRRIVEGARAWSTAVELAQAHDPVASIEHIGECLAVLVEDGLVDAWDRAGAVAFTLTPLGSTRLNVTLVEVGLSGRLVWRRVDASIPARRTRRAPPADDPAALVVDPSPGPAEVVERADDLARYLASRRTVPAVDLLPRPTVLLMGSQTTWTERRRVDRANGKCKACKDRVRPGRWCEACGKGVCPCCKGLKLRATEYCLRCGRWGLDGVARSQRRAERVARESREAAS